MDCKYVEENVIDYLMHTLKDETKKAFLQHLAQCNKCANFVKEMEATHKLLGVWLSPKESKETLPKDASFKIHQRIYYKQKMVRKRIFIRVAASILIAFGVTLFLLVSRGEKVDIVKNGKEKSNGWEEKVAKLVIPDNEREKIILLSQLIGASNFELSCDKSTDEFIFISNDSNLKLCNVDNFEKGLERLEKTISIIFPRARVLKCKVNKRNVVGYLYLT